MTTYRTIIEYITEADTPENAAQDFLEWSGALTVGSILECTEEFGADHYPWADVIIPGEVPDPATLNILISEARANLVTEANGVSTLDQLLLDLFTTACEGGINYWCALETCHWAHRQETENGIGNEDYQGFYATVDELDVEAPVTHRIDRAVMAKGYGMATSADWRGRIKWSAEKPPIVVRPGTEWDFDADDADIIVQLALFGAVKYG